MRKKELIHLLEERQQRVDYLMKRVDTMEDLIRGYREREQSVIDAMASAHRAADDYMAEAVKRAESILNSARDEASSAVSAAKAEAEKTVSIAKERAEALKKDAEKRSTELLSKTEATVAEYEATVKAYNRAIEESAVETMRHANRYIEILKARKLSTSELGAEVFGVSEIPSEKNVALPDTEGDPAKLMHNIYQLQKRSIPDAAEEQAASAATEDETAKPLDIFEALKSLRGYEGGEKAADAAAAETDGVPVYTASYADAEDHGQPAPDEVPKVGQFVEEDGSVGAMSLDDLLDEIIEAGEKIKNG